MRLQKPAAWFLVIIVCTACDREDRATVQAATSTEASGGLKNPAPPPEPLKYLSAYSGADEFAVIILGDPGLIPAHEIFFGTPTTLQMSTVRYKDIYRDGGSTLYAVGDSGELFVPVFEGGGTRDSDDYGGRLVVADGRVHMGPTLLERSGAQRSALSQAFPSVDFTAAYEPEIRRLRKQNPELVDPAKN